MRDGAAIRGAPMLATFFDWPGAALAIAVAIVVAQSYLGRRP